MVTITGGCDCYSGFDYWRCQGGARAYPECNNKISPKYTPFSSGESFPNDPRNIENLVQQPSSGSDIKLQSRFKNNIRLNQVNTSSDGNTNTNVRGGEHIDTCSMDCGKGLSSIGCRVEKMFSSCGADENLFGEEGLFNHSAFYIVGGLILTMVILKEYF